MSVHYKGFYANPKGLILNPLSQLWKQKLHQYIPNNPEPSQRGWRIIWATLSPDGKWIAWVTHDETRNVITESLPNDWNVVSLDGTQWLGNISDSTDALTDGAIWTHGSKKCFLLNYDGTVDVLDIQTHKIRSQKLSQWLPGYTRSGYTYTVLVPLGLRADGRGLVAVLGPEGNGPMRPVSLADFNLERKAPPPHRVRVSLPQQRHIEDIVLSPDGRWLAWYFLNMGKHKRIAQDPDASPDLLSEFWISHADGTGLRQLGWLPADLVGPNHDDILLPEALQWMPDGKHLSFIYNNALYTVPAD